MNHPASFRDPAGFLFRHDDVLYRQVNSAGAADLELLNSSGLYDELTGKGLLVEHSVADASLGSDGSCCVLEPKELPIISYPYEWCFSQLKDAALLTLELQLRALKKGMVLKDASAYNVQFDAGKPVFIDTLSFTTYDEGKPWAAYRQFCQHFLAPLALMAKVDIRLSALSRVHLDGVPLDLASRLLGRRGWLSLGLAPHVHLHARSQQRHSSSAAETSKPTKAPQVSRKGLEGIVQSLKSTVEKLTWKPAGTEWIDYYEANNNYTSESLDTKQELVVELLGHGDPKEIWDLGANTGRFSRAAASLAPLVVAWDIDPACVEANYRQVRQANGGPVLPLLLDLTNPSPGLGWAHQERDPFVGRSKPDAILALGLVHHMAIANNVPLGEVLALFRALAPNAVVEWIPKADSQVRKLLASREDIFDHYTEEGFEQAAQAHFAIAERRSIENTERVLYRLTASA